MHTFPPLLSLLLLSRVTAFTFDSPIVPAALTDPQAIELLSKITPVDVTVPTTIARNGRITVTYTLHKHKGSPPSSLPPIVLLHGFDSSCLEFRRLGPKLCASVDVYSVDIQGWGFGECNPSSNDKKFGASLFKAHYTDKANDNILSFSAETKLKVLRAFVEQFISAPTISVLGASLGGALALDYATTYSSSTHSLILLDAQCSVDGLDPVAAALPPSLMRLGVTGVLKKKWLRNVANQASYVDREKFATEDALICGGLHCENSGWADAMVDFMSSGGFSPSQKVKTLECNSLVVWGAEDKILPVSDAEKFVGLMTKVELKERLIVDRAGHVPHLERPEVVAEGIVNFWAKF
ncbi:hypothetical protein ScalyP_jg10645 [Parmales sp. scaly parma]|nr:hypothetical protein ScalyP_jg10645 [Parmales sp. scaly parma]